MTESLLKDEIANHMDKHSFQGKNQHGLWEAKSCLTNLFWVHCAWIQTPGREPVLHLAEKSSSPGHRERAEAVEAVPENG